MFTVINETALPVTARRSVVALDGTAEVWIHAAVGSGPQDLVEELPPMQSLLAPGVDVFVLGLARPPSPCRRLALRVEMGRRVVEMTVHGDRRWVRAGGRLIPSEPEAFGFMPLDWSRAFGGASRSEGVLMEYPLNPCGRGYAATEGEAEGQLLPNLEEAPGRTEWSGTEMPLSPAPLAFSSPLRWSAHADGGAPPEHGELPWAASPFHLEELPPGEVVRVSGATGEPMEVRVPDSPASVRVALGESRARTYELPLHLAAVALRPDRGAARWVFRCTFRYAIRDGERRICRVRGAGQGGSGSHAGAPGRAP